MQAKVVSRVVDELQLTATPCDCQQYCPCKCAVHAGQLHLLRVHVHCGGHNASTVLSGLQLCSIGCPKATGVGVERQGVGNHVHVGRATTSSMGNVKIAIGCCCLALDCQILPGFVAVLDARRLSSWKQALASTARWLQIRASLHACHFGAQFSNGATGWTG